MSATASNLKQSEICPTSSIGWFNSDDGLPTSGPPGDVSTPYGESLDPNRPELRGIRQDRAVRTGTTVSNRGYATGQDGTSSHATWSASQTQSPWAATPVWVRLPPSPPL
jgi:hypothetical protein